MGVATFEVVRFAIACILLLAGCGDTGRLPPDADSEGGDGEEECTAPNDHLLGGVREPGA